MHFLSLSSLKHDGSVFCSFTTYAIVPRDKSIEVNSSTQTLCDRIHLHACHERYNIKKVNTTGFGIQSRLYATTYS